MKLFPFLSVICIRRIITGGLKEWQTGGEKGYLMDTCLLMQDQMKNILDYFRIDYYKESIIQQDAGVPDRPA